MDDDEVFFTMFEIKICLHPSTKLLIRYGDIKSASDIEEGDVILGIPDLNVVTKKYMTSRQKLYRIIPTYGDSFIVGEYSQILVYDTVSKEMHQIFLKYLIEKKYSHFSLCKTSIELPQDDESIDIDPYLVGIILGNTDVFFLQISSPVHESVQQSIEFLGLDHNFYENVLVIQMTPENEAKMLDKFGFDITKSKFIPEKYKINSKAIRNQILAGIIDYNSCVHHSNNFITICDLNEKMMDDINYICLSLGYFVQKFRQGGTFSIRLHGNLRNIPLRVKEYNLNPCVNQNFFRVAPIAENQDSVVLELDDYNNIILGDFTIL